ncbi:MAG: MFS transporter [Azonexus sp.]|nr:MFS transporter [Betaproteobacteria bacterium]MBK8917333.1 MFS transporter [Betaproteobacteria bacterium]MBP6035096.1 MFS transporter [Azonexus sp.]MBP6905926.1 MFS transporter [Azonexus sp.]
MHVLPYWRLSGYYFFYFAFIGAFSPYFGLYLQSLHFSAWDIGLLMSQMQLMRVFGPNLWGWMADRKGHRVAIVRLASLLALLGFTAFFWFDRLTPMLAAMAVLAFFWSAALPLVEALTFDHLRDEGARYGRVRLWGSVGFIVAVLGAGALLDRVPVAGIVWICWAILLGILLLALVLPEAPPVRAAGEAPGLRDILGEARVRALLGACVAMSAAHGALYVFYSIHLADHGYSTTAVGILWSLGVVAEIGVFMLMPRLLARYSVEALLAFSFAVAVLRFLLIGWAVDSLLLAILAQTLHGVTFGVFHAAAIAAVNHWFPGRAQGRGQALYSSLSFGAGGLLGGLASGWVWDALGAGWTYTLSSGFALAGLVLMLACGPARRTVR